MKPYTPELRVILSYFNKKSNAAKYIQDSFFYTAKNRDTRFNDLINKHLGAHTGAERYKGGSVFFEDDGKGGNLIKTTTDLLKKVSQARWQEIGDPDPTCRRFMTEDIQGLMGLVDLKDIPRNTVNPVQITYRVHKKGDTGQTSIRGHIHPTDVPAQSSLGRLLPSTVIVIQKGEKASVPGGYIIALYPTDDPRKHKSVSPQPKTLNAGIKQQVESKGSHTVSINHAQDQHGLSHALLD